MIEVEYKDYKFSIVPLEKITRKRHRIGKRIIIEDATGLKIHSFESLGDTNHHIDRAKLAIDTICGSKKENITLPSEPKWLTTFGNKMILK